MISASAVVVAASVVVVVCSTVAVEADVVVVGIWVVVILAAVVVGAVLEQEMVKIKHETIKKIMMYLYVFKGFKCHLFFILYGLYTKF